MHSRILLGVAAWLVGASVATSGSLLAVSVLGQDLIPVAGEALTAEPVRTMVALRPGVKFGHLDRPPAGHKSVRQ